MKYYAGYYSHYGWDTVGHGKTIEKARENLKQKCIKIAGEKAYYNSNWFSSMGYEEGEIN